MSEFRVLSPTAILGYGFPRDSFAQGMAQKPHVVAVDAGSTDPGPYYLGAGVSFTDRQAVKTDLSILLAACRKERIPLIIGSAGGAGGEPHLQWTLDIIKEIAQPGGYDLKVAVIPGEITKEWVLQKWRQGAISPLPGAPSLSETDIGNSCRVVGQMGLEPIQQALREKPDVVVAGRAYDPAVFAALPIQAGYDPGLALHMGKILECACIAAEPGSGSDCMLGYLGPDYFRVEPLHPSRRCTTLSVAAHTLYEKSNPYQLPGPGGILDLTNTEFVQESDRAVRVMGSRFIPSAEYTVKIEGALKIGYRTLSIAGVRDPLLIAKIDAVLADVKSRVKEGVPADMGEYVLNFRLYGRDGVMGQREPRTNYHSHELGILIEAVASDQAGANTVCSIARSTLLHYGYEGRVSTAGNLAFPFSPSDLQAGEVYAFSMYHLVQIDDPLEPFPVSILNIEGRKPE